MSHQASRPIEILLVEDDIDDVLLIKKMLQRDRIVNVINQVGDGVKAMAYLRREGEYAEASRPDLILLDLNMPLMDGHEVLKECCEDESLETIPIVVFTSSDDEHDVAASYKHKANSYITKPVDLAKFRQVLTEIQQYWFCIVTLPPSGHEIKPSQ